MATPSSMTDLSVTAASNSPAGSESPTAGDDFLRAIQAILRHTNAKGADIASATTTDIGAATGEFVDVTGTTTITGLGTIAAGIVRTVRFTGALTLTHNATSLILPSAANITTAANDIAQFRSLGSGNWQCVFYSKAAGYAKAGVNSDITRLTAAAVTVATDDKVLIQDTSDSDNLKTVTTQAIANLNATVYLSEAEYITGTETAKALNAAVARAQNLILSTAQATTSGATIDFTGIPSWVKKITIMLVGLSTNGSSVPIIQLGDAGGIEATGYLGGASGIAAVVSSTNFTTGFGISNSAAAADVTHGAITLTLQDSSTNTWVANGVTSKSNTAYSSVCAGSKSLSATLDRLRLTTVNGTDTFDAGSINIMYE